MGKGYVVPLIASFRNIFPHFPSACKGHCTQHLNGNKSPQKASIRSAGLLCSVNRPANRRQAVTCVITRHFWSVHPNYRAKKKKTRSSTALSSTHISKSNQVQSINKKKFSLKNATTVVNVQPPYPLHPSLSLTAIYCSSYPWTCACRHLLHSQTSDENYLIAFHVATCRRLHRVSANLQHGCLSSIQTPATFPFAAHFIPVFSLSSWWQYLCILLISAWNSVLDSLVSAPHIHAHSTWFISSHTTHSLLCLLSGSSTSMQSHKNRNWVSLLTSALPAPKTQILEAPCLSVEWINQPIKKKEAIKNQENNFKSVSTLKNALL